MRPLPEIALTDEPDKDDVLLLEERLYEYNVGRTGIADGRVLALFARDGDGAILGGLYGWTWGKTCEIRSLWVTEPWRGHGLAIPCACRTVERNGGTIWAIDGRQGVVGMALPLEVAT